MAWTIGNFYLTQAQMEENALEVYNTLDGYGWSLNAISGILGNMQSESNINPGLWQSLYEGNYSGGFGLVQWTPATNYTNWAAQNGYGISDPAGQLYWINNVTTQAGQWISTNSYPLSFYDFKVSAESPEYLASAFLKNFERAGVEVEAQRQTQARYWYDYLGQYAGGSQKLDQAVQNMIDLCNDDTHGYDQANRWGPDYDCSSAIVTALQNAGFDTGNASNTSNMSSELCSRGWNRLSASIEKKCGDILLCDGSHVAMYIGSGQLAEFSQNEFGGITGGQTGDQTGREGYVHGYYDFPWKCVLRYPGADRPEPQGVYIVRWIPA